MAVETTNRSSLRATIGLTFQVLGDGARRKMSVLGILMLMGGALESAGVGLVFPLLAMITRPEMVHQNETIRALHVAIGEPSVDMFLIVLCAGLLAVIVLKNIFSAYLVNAQARFVWQSRRRLSSYLFRRYVRSDLPFHLNTHSSEITRGLIVSVNQIFGKFLMPLLLLATEGLVVLFVIAVLLVVDLLVTVVALVVLGTTVGAFYMVSRRRIAFWGEEVHATSGRLLRTIGQSLGGIKELKVFRKEAYFEGLFSEAINANSRAMQHYQAVTQYPRLMLETIAAGSILITVAVVVASGNRAGDVIPLVGLFGVAAIRLMPSLNRIIAQVASIRFVLPSIGQVLDDIQATEGSASGEAAIDEPPALLLEREVVFDNVTFAYAAGSEPVLQNVSLRIPCGTSVALVGRTGAGKTTLANLLLGLFQPTDGEILFDDRPYSGADMRALQANLAFIPQDVFLLDDSIRNNVAFGVPQSEIDEGRMREAIRLAHLDDVVAALPQGLDTVIGERGARISGGQRQRLGIARALYRDARMIVLDEATSALDSGTESEISRVLHELHGQRTLVIIAHRPSTIRPCDRIFVLEDGRIADSGDFETLVARNASFRRIAAYEGMESPVHA